MRLGLFGGTFDPIHLGHLILAESCREALGLDRVWFVVAGAPPHKRGDRTPVADRLEMARIAVAGHPAFEVSEIEARGPGPPYSYATLEAVRLDRPDDELFFLIGGDSLVDLPGWRRPERIAELATIVVVGRPGAAIGPAAGAGSGPGSGGSPGAFDLASRVRVVESPLIDIASSDLRRRVAEGRSIRYRVPRGVEAYIRGRGLYGGRGGG
jgi:nicotinate-nucleotide adenylyltransferase